MRMWLTAAAMVAGCWLGVLWPLLVLSAVAVVGVWRYRSLWLVWLVLGWRTERVLVVEVPGQPTERALGRISSGPRTERALAGLSVDHFWW